MLHYALLHLTGYPLTMTTSCRFASSSRRRPATRVPPHARCRATTGPLGQGHTNAVGFAIAERMLANRFNKPGHTLVDHYTYALISDETSWRVSPARPPRSRAT